MARLLVSNNNLNTQQIGEVVDTKDDGHVWGGREGLPNYVHIDITDATRDQVVYLTAEWKIKYVLNIQVNNPQRIRYQIEVAAASISASGVGRAQLKTEMQQWAESQYNATVLAFTPETFTIDVPKPFDPVQFEKDFADIWKVVFDIRQYHFSQTDVTAAVTAGGTISFTLAEMLARIVNKLDL